MNENLNENEFVLPFPDESQKVYSGSLYNLNVFGLPDGINGVNKRNQLMWNKNGVALAYMLVPTLKSAVDVIAQNLSGVPMFLKNQKGDIVARSDASGSSSSKFLNAIEKSYKYYGVPLFELWSSSISLYGECVIEKVPLMSGDIVSLKWLNPLATYAELRTYQDDNDLLYANGKSRIVEKKIFRYSGIWGSADYTESEVLYSRAFNPVDDIRGYSNALSALSKANISIEFENFTLAFYANNGHPGVIISPRDKLVGEAQIREWQRDWQEKYRGSQEQFKTHISGFPFDVHTFDILDISKPLEVSKDAETKILRAFRVPPEMIGDTTENSYQFSKESKNAFMQTVVRPMALSISNCINHSTIIGEISEEEVDYKFGFDFSEFENVAKTDLDKQEVLQRQVQSAGMSLGQYQRTLGYDVVDGSDNTYLIPQGFIVVKKDGLSNPETLPTQPNDQRGPDKGINKPQDRQTQSETKEQESVDFFGSKSYQNISTINQKLVIPEKYSMLDVNVPKDIQNSLKQHFQAIIVDGQMSPNEIRKCHQKYYKVVDEVSDAFNDNEGVYSWLEKIVTEMDKMDKQEAKKSITILKLQEIAKENGITIESALKMFDEFDNDY